MGAVLQRVEERHRSDGNGTKDFSPTCLLLRSYSLVNALAAAGRRWGGTPAFYSGRGRVAVP